MACHARLQIVCLVLVNHVGLGQLIDHSEETGHFFFYRALVTTVPYIAQCVTHGFVLILVAQTLYVIASYALERRLVICHFLFVSKNW